MSTTDTTVDTSNGYYEVHPWLWDGENRPFHVDVGIHADMDAIESVSRALAHDLRNGNYQMQDEKATMHLRGPLDAGLVRYASYRNDPRIGNADDLRHVLDEDQYEPFPIR